MKKAHLTTTAVWSSWNMDEETNIYSIIGTADNRMHGDLWYIVRSEFLIEYRRI